MLWGLQCIAINWMFLFSNKKFYKGLIHQGKQIVIASLSLAYSLC